MRLFEKQSPKVLYLSDMGSSQADIVSGNRMKVDDDDVEDKPACYILLRKKLPKDEPDRLPKKLIVRNFDIFCFIFAMITYFLDVGSDIFVAYIHYEAERVWAFALIMVLTVAPSLVLNVVSFMWWLDDDAAMKRGEITRLPCLKNIPMRIVICLLQLAPVMWYVEAAHAAINFRTCGNVNEKKRLYCRMIEADRDASLLRFFEAFLESAPQLLIQGTVLGYSFWLHYPDENFPVWMYFQIISIGISLLSVCWSISIQHRALRLSQPDKVNLTAFESFLQFVWHCLTVSARYICFVLFVLAFQYWIALFFIVHFSLSLVHVIALQNLDSGSSYIAVEVGLLLICAVVHLFTPFNMAEGPTKIRFIVAYILEAFENSIMMYLVYSYIEFDFPCKNRIIITAAFSFALGILIMIIYYSMFHPNRRFYEFENGKKTPFPQSVINSTAAPDVTITEEPLKYIDSDYSEPEISFKGYA